MRRTLTERQKEVATGLTILLVVGLAFAAGEILLRVVQMSRFGTATTVERSAQFVVDPVTELRLPRPGSAHGRIHYNSLGFRGPELPMPKPAGVLRIAYLGSSTTLDAYASDAGSWPAVATAFVKDALGSCSVDHLNAGVAGFATDRMLRYFDGRVARTEPDLVIVLPRDINLDLDEYVVRHGLHDGVHLERSWLARHSVLWSKLETNATIIRRQRSASRASGQPDLPAAEITPAFGHRLRALLTDIRVRGGQPVLLAIDGHMRREQSRSDQVAAAATDLLYMPYVTIEGLLDLRDAYNTVIREVGSELGVPVIEAHLAVPGDARHFQDSLHYTPAGSAVAGRAIGAALLKLSEVQRLAERCAVVRSAGS